MQLEELVNGVLECELDPKKIKYLYLRYDYPNFGYFELGRLTAEIFTERKPVTVAREV